jgi:hypothetical protein
MRPLLEEIVERQLIRTQADRHLINNFKASRNVAAYSKELPHAERHQELPHV